MAQPSIIKDMESGGMIRCTQCGYKNSPVYHYCGVCGAVLQPAKDEAAAKAVAPEAPAYTPEPLPPIPPAPTRAERSEPAVNSGMSFLGLSEAPSSSSPSYLLDEQEEGERSAAWGRISVVLILLVAAVGFGVQWYRGGYPFAAREQAPVASAPAAVTTPATADSATATPSTPVPAAAAETADVSKPAVEPPAATASTPVDTTPAAAAKTETPAETKPAPPAEAEKTEPAPEKKAAPVVMATKTAPARVKTPPPAPEPVEVPGEAQYVQGQRYLYGTGGVQANCDLALRSLLGAASRLHVRAESTLGTMYSTGHCVTRDLPSAYRWFAKALHADPNNLRLEQDLNVVWRQMTPGERQMATKAN